MKHDEAVAPVLAVATGLDEYQRRVLAAAHDVLAPRGIPLLAHIDGPYVRGARSSLLISLLERVPIGGLISMNAKSVQDEREMAAILSRLEVPVVHVGTEVEGGVCVRGDNVAGLREVMRHLLAVRGPRHVALVRGTPHQPDSVEREVVVREELRRVGIDLDESLVVTGEFSAEVTYPAVEALLRQRRDIDAVIAMNDRSALAAIDALTDAGLRVPEDVAVVGFDNERFAAHWPGLTSVDQNLDEQGRLAAELVLRQHEGDRTPTTVVVPSRAVLRGSTAPRGEAAVTDLATAVSMAKVERERLAQQDGILAMSYALDYCWTIDDVVRVLAGHLDRLQVVRGFLALYERSYTGGHSEELAVDVSTSQVRLVMDHRDGQLQPLVGGPYPAHQLLPDHLADQLRTGLLVVEPLAVLDRPFGFVIFEQRPGAAKLTELIRIDLSRALDAVLTTQELQERTTVLEEVVERRTRELQAEVVTRRRAERELQAANAELQRSAMLDGLTQIANRTAFGQHLERCWRDQIGRGEPLALLMVDVDAFKLYNDHYGHLLGDDALRTLASCLDRSVWGADDLVCRYGGEEFAVVLPRSGRHAAVAVAQRFQELLAEAAVPHAASPVAPVLTASIGIAVATPRRGSDPDDLVAQADQALYRAKSLGRDRIQLADSDQAQTPAGHVGRE